MAVQGSGPHQHKAGQNKFVSRWQDQVVAGVGGTAAPARPSILPQQPSRRLCDVRQSDSTDWSGAKFREIFTLFGEGPMKGLLLVGGAYKLLSYFQIRSLNFKVPHHSING